MVSEASLRPHFRHSITVGIQSSGGSNQGGSNSMCLSHVIADSEPPTNGAQGSSASCPHSHPNGKEAVVSAGRLFHTTTFQVAAALIGTPPFPQAGGHRALPAG
jgi:hypothetical protein